ncbi:MAG: hypothetical protein A2358_01580 [Candidatus Staskawiczbacteria bacterium RIFOXYB1_FULL_37_44]|uniref:DUF5652 domain-containing protein n=1 Tax=Candidatus Staskawiczbacteria bacterium RIFOXYB1_FULL_37_44 TaxID=1802223 RepID=A0A1G2IYE0_9BACT|nr:MAG: hypothetical protein A2358_01580 [Candidatus Staskawiczbacteria bacterium RIFOXYB1_FULL_37_44]OGZ83397.1 MAG: hypothetical protein A2416_02315 [Candidatus Staskawiczbacteria bacterium RIFOXYC1_FULL_37_52]OGZ88248.1 MAG: hypothetical protein A2444_00485 [Candidatus Staskawiczbacteria bacterium RIFOXYC2_FULL_37_19]OGZ88800.1 MAG: hypothetical protein A2581_03255 [Candidatus Staskawiczbacteria bacterium RIFOXYD1_FULL_37_110]
MFEPYQDVINIIGLTSFTALFVMLAVWTAIWKGIALWKAARNGSKGWYIAMLIINTAGILEILYIFLFSKKNKNNPVA